MTNEDKLMLAAQKGVIRSINGTIYDCNNVAIMSRMEAAEVERILIGKGIVLEPVAWILRDP